jgi:hypothetical protein
VLTAEIEIIEAGVRFVFTPRLTDLSHLFAQHTKLPGTWSVAGMLPGALNPVMPSSNRSWASAGRNPIHQAFGDPRGGQ